MADLSPEMETAMLALLQLCPQAMDDMGPRWVESVCMGEREASGEKESIDGSAHTCIMASEEPDRKKLEEGSTTMHVTGWRWDVEVETSRPEQIWNTHIYISMFPRCSCRIRATTNLPRQYPPALGAQQQHAVLGGKGNAMYPLWKRHQRFLVALFSAVNMDNRLVRLRGKNVRAAHSNAIWRSCALLEDMSLGDQWLELVDENAGILGDAGIWLGRGRYGGHKLFGEHGRMWLSTLSCRETESSKL